MARSIQCGLVSLLFLLRLLTQGRLAALDWVAQRCPGIARIRLGARTAFLLNTPELVEEVLIRRPDEFRKSPALRVFSRPLLGKGLLTSEGAEHRMHRRLVAPAFAHHRVPRYAAVMSQMANECCARWPENGVVHMHREMTRLTLGIVGRTLFDADLLEDADEIGRHITYLLRRASAQARSILPIPQRWPTPAKLRAWRSVARLNDTVYGMIRRRRESGEDKGDLLSMLLLTRDEEGKSLDDTGVRDEAMTLFLAGHETTANAATWSLYLLARHPEIQDAVRREVSNAIGSRAVQFDDLPQLPLALQVFKEALRLYPPAYIVVREALQDLEIGGAQVCKGQLVALSEYLLHRNPAYFPDPLRFDPTRFTPENEARIHRYAYFPFGAGRRICIGNQFALMEGQMILATVLQHVTIRPLSWREWKAEPLLTLRPRGSAPLQVERV